MTRTQLRPLTPAQLRRRSDELAPVDAVILHVNGVLADPVRRKAALAVAAGEVYHITVNQRLTPAEAQELEQRFQASNWPGGQVVVWQDRTAVVLHARARGLVPWESAYDGKPLAQVLRKAA